MEYILNGVKEAFIIIFSFEEKFLEIVFVSIKVSFASTVLGTLLGVPVGILVAEKKFFGRNTVITILNTLMSLPTVVVGLMLYSLLSRRGPFGGVGLLFTPTAIIIGQSVLIFPIISGLTITAIRSLDKRVWTTAMSLGADRYQGFLIFLHEARYGILAAVIAGFSRVFAEVGVSMMLGGNIKGYTRNITTAIALETSKGDFSLGIALGFVLLTVAFTINLMFTNFQKRMRYEYL